MPKYILRLAELLVQMPPNEPTIGREDAFTVIAKDQSTAVDRATERFMKKYEVNRMVVLVREIAWGGDNKRAKKAPAEIRMTVHDLNLGTPETFVKT